MTAGEGRGHGSAGGPEAPHSHSHQWDPCVRDTKQHSPFTGSRPDRKCPRQEPPARTLPRPTHLACPPGEDTRMPLGTKQLAWGPSHAL